MTILEATEKIECIRFLEYGKRIKMAISNTQGIEIDTPEDLVRANKVLKEEKRLPINNKYRNFPMVPKVVYGKGLFRTTGQYYRASTQRKSALYLFGRRCVSKQSGAP